MNCVFYGRWIAVVNMPGDEVEAHVILRAKCDQSWENWRLPPRESWAAYVRGRIGSQHRFNRMPVIIRVVSRSEAVRSAPLLTDIGFIAHLPIKTGKP